MNDIRGVDLNLLRTLSVLLEEQSVSRTAARLHLTQPTVSGMLSRLRVIFDDPLFVRTQRGILPTPRAEALAPSLRRLISDAQALVSPVAFDPQTSTETLTLSANDYLQSVLVVPLLSRIRDLAPKMRLRVVNAEVSELVTRLANGDIDLALTIPEFTDASLHTQFLYREEYVAAVRRGHPIRSKRVSLQRFLAFEHALVSPSTGSFSGPTDVALGSLGAKRHVAVSVPSFFTLSEMLHGGDYIALMPERFFAQRAETLRTIAAPVEVPGFDVIAAWHTRTHYEPIFVWLREQLGALISAQETGGARGEPEGGQGPQG